MGREGRGCDLYGLGKFNQKGDISTRCGIKHEFLSAIKSHGVGIPVYADIVLDHTIQRRRKDEIETDGNGKARFVVNSQSVSAWAKV